MQRAALFATLLAVALALLGGALAPTDATSATTSCASGTHGSAGYAYAGRQSVETAHGVRATISPTRQPSVTAGHVAGWVGVGGPRQGRNGETMWLQAGVAGIPGLGLLVYGEITRPGVDPVFLPLEQDVAVGQPFRIAVLEMAKRPDYWRIWLNGQPVSDPIHLPGSSGAWKPIATAESYSPDPGTCNTFGFRFAGVGVAGGRGGSWKTFVPGYRFLDRGYTLRPLRSGANGDRSLSAGGPKPYAFEASSAS